MTMNLFVGNLPKTATRDEVWSFIHAAVGSPGLEQVRLHTKANGTFKGAAFVEVDSEASRDKALGLNGKPFPGTKRIVSVQLSKSKKGGRGGKRGAQAATDDGTAGKRKRKTDDEGPFTCVVGNLPYQADAAGIKSFFKPFVHVKEIRILVDAATGEPRGCALAHFHSRHDMRAALAGDQKPITDPDTGRSRLVNVSVSKHSLKKNDGKKGGAEGGGKKEPNWQLIKERKKKKKQKRQQPAPGQ